MPKRQNSKFKWDILGNFQTMWKSLKVNLRACINAWLLEITRSCVICERGIEMACGGRKIGSNRPNWQTVWLAGKFGRQEEWADMPHHWQRMPVRQSSDQQAFLHLTHLELLGKLPSWKWCGVAWRDSLGVLVELYVAFSTQLGMANSWHESWTK